MSWFSLQDIFCIITTCHFYSKGLTSVALLPFTALLIILVSAVSSQNFLLCFSNHRISGVSLNNMSARNPTIFSSFYVIFLLALELSFTSQMQFLDLEVHLVLGLYLSTDIIHVFTFKGTGGTGDIFKIFFYNSKGFTDHFSF